MSIDPRTLSKAVDGLTSVDARHGFRLALIHMVVLNSLLFLTFWVDQPQYFFGLAMMTAVYYSAVMITSHDAIHHTLSGWYYFDEFVPRCFGYFIFWPHGLYAELHKLHHKQNGKDLADPERPTYSTEEYRASSRLGRWVIRHQWWISLFVSGGVGMLYRHIQHGIKLWPNHRSVRRAMVTDAVGIAFSFSIVIGVVLAFDIGLRFLVYILCVERVIGFFMQLRSHIEHYGLHVDAGPLIDTRLANCRNIVTNRFVSRFFNGLNFHSVHHAFPRIPYYNLREAHRRISAICQAAGQPLVESHGYVKTCIELARRPVLVEPGQGPEVPVAAWERAS